MFSEKIGKALMKTLKTFGVRADDITGFLDDMELDKQIVSALESVKEEGTEVALLGYKKSNGEFAFKAVSLSSVEINDREFVVILPKSHELEFFGKSIKNISNELLSKNDS